MGTKAALLRFTNMRYYATILSSIILSTVCLGTDAVAHDKSGSRSILTSVESVNETALEAKSALAVQMSDMPENVIDLEIDIEAVQPKPRNQRLFEGEPSNYPTGLNFEDVDLVDQEEIFLGAYDRTEFDTVKAQQESAGMPENLDADPLIPIGAVGVEAKF